VTLLPVPLATVPRIHMLDEPTGHMNEQEAGSLACHSASG
jgi:hypothetical protein